MTALIIVLAAGAVVGVALLVRGEYRRRRQLQAAQRARAVEREIDELWISLWMNRVKARQELDASTPDQ